METLNSDTCEIIIKNTDDKNAPHSDENIYITRSNYINETIDKDTPLVSIWVLAYNNLEKYTKGCMECILKYTSEIDFELVLVDNGSSDGTLEYFKSIPHKRKKIIKITKNIGAYYGGNEGHNYSSGKYVVGLANDVYVTRNWLTNMLKCAMSDPNIGMVTPVSDYISNNQSVDLGYSDLDDMQVKAEKYNVSDPAKWEERIRLITIGTLYKKECLDLVGIGDYGFVYDFGDDDITFRIRRAGYKAVLCRDVFVSHIGKPADKGSEFAAQSLLKGKKIFQDKYYGIDAWDDVNNFEPSMMSLVKTEEIVTKEPEILGIDVLCGTPILELKNKLRKYDVFHAKLNAFSTEAKYWIDLKTICEGKVEVDRPEFILEHFENMKFDYIVLGNPINCYKDPYKLLLDTFALLKENGQLLIKLNNTYDVNTLLNIMDISKPNNNNKPNHHISLEALNVFINENGHCCNNFSAEFLMFDENTTALIKKLVGNLKNENTYNKMMVKYYVISILKKNS